MFNIIVLQARDVLIVAAERVPPIADFLVVHLLQVEFGIWRSNLPQGIFDLSFLKLVDEPESVEDLCVRDGFCVHSLLD